MRPPHPVELKRCHWAVDQDAALNPDADQYEVFEFPAMLHENTESEKSLGPSSGL